MSEIREFLAFDISLEFVLFFMLISMGLAIFHTVLFTGLYNLTLRPKWIFFALNPLLILVSYFIFPALATVMFGFLAASIFLLAIIGAIRSAIIGDPEIRRYRKGKPKKPLWKRLVAGVGLLVFGLVFLSSGPYAFIIIFAIAFISAILPSSKNRFKKYQATLPTSKIRSMAMGLVEVEGKITTDTPLLARIEKIECIGYKYVIESISKDKDGKLSYSEIFSETVCNPFVITDETGSVAVNPDNIELIWVDLDGQYSSGSKRYSQYLLKQNDHVFIIGKASVSGNKPVIVHENIKDVFGIAPFSKVTEYNTNKPLLNSFAFFSCVLAIMVAFVLVSSITIKGEEVVVQLNAAFFYWDSFVNLIT